MKKLEVPEIKLKIEYSSPVRLDKLSLCYFKLSDEYNCFVKDRFRGIHHEDEISLCIKEIKSGSIELVISAAHYLNQAAASMMPAIVEHRFIILEFGKYLKSIFDYFLDKGPRPDELTKKTCQSMGDMMEVIASNPNSSINIHVTDCENTKVEISIGNQEANSIQNKVRKEMDKIKEVGDFDRKEVILIWHQVKKGEGSVEGRTGDKAVIEEIMDRPLKVYFPENLQDIKSQMTGQENNPLKKAYIVDVKVRTVKGKPVAYWITHFYEEVELDD